MQAYAAAYGFSEALSTMVEVELPVTEDLAREVGHVANPAAAAVKRNKVCVAALTMTCKEPTMLLILLEGRTVEWPSGLAHRIIQGLVDRYTPMDQTSLVEFHSGLEKVHMKKGANPDELFTQLMTLRIRFGPGIPGDASLIARAIHVAPMEYRQVITAEQLRLRQPLTLSRLQMIMRAHWRNSQGNVHVKEAHDGEVTLASFGGQCWTCKEFGHRSNECPKSKGKFRGECNHCGKVGHMAKDCWHKPENNNNGRRYGEHGNAAISGNYDTEILLCQVTGTKTTDLLDNPNIWVCDTGATVDATPYDVGMVNKKKAISTDDVTMGNGATEQASWIREIAGI
jgi:Zinc knuckle